ncbi:MAG: MFS transporter [Myxococcales bacterium]|nr:MFS transporter [Myxococcales bacterium]
MTAPDASRPDPEAGAALPEERGFLLRLYLHAFVARLYFYLPVVVLHMERQLGEAGFERPRALSLSMLALISAGVILAEYPSGVLADWGGRKRTLIMAGVIQCAGILCFAVERSLLAICLAQLLIGVGTAFRSGADTSLVHSYLESRGRAPSYGTTLARLRFCNVLAMASSSACGGLLYARDPRLVFWLAAGASLLGALLLVGVREPAGERRGRPYMGVLRQSLDELRTNHAARALTLLGGVGNPYFVLAFWAAQSYLVDIETPLPWLGVTVASMSLLQGLTMPLSAYLGQSRRRTGAALSALVMLPALSFLLVAWAWWSGRPFVGTAALVLTSGCHVLYRNAVNLKLQAIVPDAVRASIVSMEAFIGSLWYLGLFPLAGWLLSSAGTGRGFFVIALLAAVSITPSLRRALRAGVFRSGPMA